MGKTNLDTCSFCGCVCWDGENTRIGVAESDTPSGLPLLLTVACRDCYIKEKLPGWEKVAGALA